MLTIDPKIIQEVFKEYYEIVHIPGESTKFFTAISQSTNFMVFYEMACMRGEMSGLKTSIGVSFETGFRIGHKYALAEQVEKILETEDK